MEAGLPSWWKLVQALLDRAAIERLDLTDETVRSTWREMMLRGETPLGPRRSSRRWPKGN